jgi:integrase
VNSRDAIGGKSSQTGAGQCPPNARVEVRDGTHTADRRSVTVAEAGKLWIASGENNKLERATIDGYQQHLDLHITPFLGRVKLSQDPW